MMATTDRPTLNANVRTLCARHWDGSSRGCGGCPIRAACHSGPRVLSYEELDAHKLRRNAAADAVIAQESINTEAPTHAGT